MRIEPRLKYYKEGQRLTLNSVNSIIRRIEYGAGLLNGLKLIAGEGITFEGGKIKALKQDEYPKLPFGVKPPINPIVLSCTGSVGWSKIDSFGFDVCPNVGSPCSPPSPDPSCLGLGVDGYIVSGGIWPKSCLGSPKCAFAASFDDGGTIGDKSFPYPGGCASSSGTGVASAIKGSYNKEYFFAYINYTAKNGPQGGPYGFVGSGSFFLS